MKTGRRGIVRTAVQVAVLAVLVTPASAEPLELFGYAGVMGEWSRQDFQVQHFMTLTAEAQIDLYRGDAVAAWQRVSDQWTGLRDAMLLHVEIVRIYMLHLRARCALAAVGSSLGSRPLLASAARLPRHLSERNRR